MIKEYLMDNNLIITPNVMKKKVITEINSLDKLVAYKVMSLDEFMKDYAFSYNKETIYYIIKKLDVSYEVALEYLKSLYFINNRHYSSLKLNDLVTLKEELIANNLLIYNNIFLDYLKNTNIIIYGYDLDPFYLNIFNKSAIKKELSSKELSVLEFSDINDELSYVVSDIRKKLDSGIDINNIKIINSGSEYFLPLKRIFNWANIPINMDNKISLYDLNVGKQVITYLNNNLSFTDIISELKNTDINILNKLINIFNEYNTFEIEKEYLIKMITYDLKNTYLSNMKFDNAVSLCDLDEVSDGDVVYLIGFNKENYPKVCKDEDFLSDNIKKELKLFTSNQLNKNNKDKLINNLYRDVNYVITYKLRDAFSDFNPCLLIEELNMEVIKNKEITYDFSNFFNKMNLAILLDNYRKYGIINDDLRRLAVTYNIPYNTYNNKFTGLDNKYFLSSLNKLGLSYTKINDYFECKFKYYLAYILKAQLTNTDHFSLDIGNVFHYVLSKYDTKDFDFDKVWEGAISECVFTKGQLVLINNLKDELKYDLNIIKKQESFSMINKHHFEEDVTVDIPNSKFSKVYFNGKIDKMIYGEDPDTNNTIVSVVDYKTGNLPKDFSDIYYGIGMQLPVYLYLVRHSKLFTNPVIAGFYLQKIINKDNLREFGKDMALEKEKKLKLFGYSNSSNSIISKFDNSYTSSKYISSLGVKDDGEFYARSKVMSNANIDELITFVDSKIKEAANGIIDGDFEINPKRKPKEKECSKCIFKDICFRKEDDYVDLEPQKEFAFLGGDDNA